MRFLLITCLCAMTLYLNAQEDGLASIEKYAAENASLLLKGLPDGVYDTYQSFKDKKPSNYAALTRKKTDDGRRFGFYYKNKKRIKKAFAIVYKGEVFFQIKLMLKNVANDSRGFTWDGGTYFLKAKVVGPFLYAEDYLTPSSAPLLGGLIAMAATRSLKPIIFIDHLQKFRVIKNFKHLKLFMDSKFPQNTHLFKPKKEMETISGENKLTQATREIFEQL